MPKSNIVNIDALFLDRDGVINRDNGYTFKFDKEIIYQDAVKFLLSNRRSVKYVFVVSNQSGIARGYYTETDLKIFTKKMKDYFRYYKITIDEILYCPHLKSAKVKVYDRMCFCRKPSPGLFVYLLRKYKLRSNRCIMIGDKDSDLVPAKKLGFKKIIKVDRKSKQKFIIRGANYFIANSLDTNTLSR